MTTPRSPSVWPRATGFSDPERADAARTVPELIAIAAAAHPDAVALRDHARTHTYRELVDRVGRWAAVLRAHGVGPEVIVGLAMERSTELVVVALAILEAGGAYLPIDPTQPDARVAYMLADAGVRVVVTDATTRGRLPQPELILIHDPDLGQLAPLPPDARPAPTQRAYVLYTSGSTGQPKGVQVEHGALSNLLVSVRRVSGFRATDVFLATSALSFDVAAAELYTPLITGGAVWVAARADLEDLDRFEAAFRASGATYLQATPSGWRQLVRLGFGGRADLTAFTVGEPLTRELADHVLARARTFYNFYGPTEATIYATVAEVPRGVAEITVGTPLDNYSIRVTNEDGVAVSRGEVGEIRIGGVGVARGYLARPELTRERFVEGEYRTGDRGIMQDDGTLLVVGRFDDQVKVRGYRVELGEVDAALLRSPEVSAAVTVRHQGVDGVARLVSYFVPRRADDAMAGDAAFVELFDGAYGAPSADVTAREPDISGYTSSYTGRPFSPDELAEYATTTARRLLALRPRHAYEIGCGTGLVARRLHPHLTSYRGSDLAPQGVRVLAAALGSDAQVWTADASDFSRVPDDVVDLVIINSAVQYFPDAEYVSRVLDGALARLTRGGVLFVGDVRHAGLAEAYWRSVVMARAGAPLSPDLLDRRVREALDGEKELLFHPEYFYAWTAQHAAVERVRVELREGRHDNEFTRFRYDVFIHTRGAESPAAVARTQVDARTLGDDPLAALRARWPGPEGLVVTHLLNARLAGRGVHPEALRALAAERGHRAYLTWASDDPTYYQAELSPPDQPALFERADRLGVLGRPEGFVRARRDRGREARVAHTLRAELSRQLPEYMIPTQLVALTAMPLNTAGKIDRAALPPAEAVRPELAVPLVEPRTPTEVTICRILEAQLGVRPVGVHDGFFDLGGNSILALSTALEIERQLGRVVSVVAFLREPTAEKLARLADGEASDLDPISPLVPLIPDGARTPLFFVHASGGRPHLLIDLVMQLRADRPLYFVQDPAWTGQVPRTESIEEMAAQYVRAIRRVQPRGPYLLGGYCFGGVVALEMAQQLEREHHAVARILMVDPSMPRTDTFPMTEVLRTQLQVVGSYLPQLADQAYTRLSARAAKGGRLSRWVARLGDKVLDDAKDRVEASRTLPHASLDVLAAHSDTRTLFELMAHHIRLWGKYQPRPWGGRAAFALSTVPSPFNEGYGDDLLGWRKVLSATPDVLRIRGATHFDMGSRPQVFEVAAFFKRVLAEADAEIARAAY